jgi:hypothetical protein
MGTRTVVDEFIHRLQEAERTFNSKELIAIFEKNAEVLNLTRNNTSTKTEHADSPEQFWRQYLHAFQKVESRFGNRIDNGEVAVLEWHSSGILPMGIPIEYSGVSILEYSGTQIKKFRTYYDSAALLPHAPTSSKSYSQTVGEPRITNEATS